jgi:hypothetical protein
MLALLFSLALADAIDYVCYEGGNSGFCKNDVASFNWWASQPDSEGANSLGHGYTVGPSGYFNSVLGRNESFSEVLAGLAAYPIIIRFFDVPFGTPENATYFSLSALTDHHAVYLDAYYQIFPGARTLEDPPDSTVDLVRRLASSDLSPTRQPDNLDLFNPALGGSGPVTLIPDSPDSDTIHNYVDSLWLRGYFAIGGPLHLRQLYLTVDEVGIVNPENLIPDDAVLTHDIYGNISPNMHWNRMTLVIPWKEWAELNWEAPRYDTIRMFIDPMEIQIPGRILSGLMTRKTLTVRRTRVLDGFFSLMLLGEADRYFWINVTIQPGQDARTLLFPEMTIILRRKFEHPFGTVPWPSPSPVMTPVMTQTAVQTKAMTLQMTPLPPPTPRRTQSIEPTPEPTQSPEPSERPTQSPVATLSVSQTPSPSISHTPSPTESRSASPFGALIQYYCTDGTKPCARIALNFGCADINGEVIFHLESVSGAKFFFDPVADLECVNYTEKEVPDVVPFVPLLNDPTRTPLATGGPPMEEGEEEEEGALEPEISLDNKAVKIMGGVIGGVAGLAIIIYVVVTIVRQRKKQAIRVRSPNPTTAQ